MSDEDPVRLKDERAASPELVRALRALGTSSDAARLERVAQKLGAALAEGQPPTVASGAGVLGVKALVIGVVAAGIAALAWFGSNAHAPVPEQPAPPAQVQAPSPPPPPTAAVEPSSPLAPAPMPANTPLKTTSRHAPARARAATAAPAGAEPRASSAPAAAAVATTQTASAATAPAPAPRADDSARKPADPQPSAAEPEPPAPSEAALLFGARKAMASQPSAALHLLDQHAARFPDGLLAPEREVLRIETLQRLGRTTEAVQRLRAFQARYPDSIHLRRLQKLVGGEH